MAALIYASQAEHERGVQERYHGSLQVLAAALQEHCGGLAEWVAPRGGMFLWVKVLVCDDASALLDELVALKVRMRMPYTTVHCCSSRLCTLTLH